MFAIALWDRIRRQLVLARDAVGIKPLFIAEAGPNLWWASEIKSFLADDQFRPSFSAVDITHLLALGYPAPDRTLINAVRQVLPGTVETHTTTGSKTWRFWKPARSPVGRTFQEATQDLKRRLSAAVRGQLVSEVPIGVLQSGGIDSSLISLSLPRDVEIPLFCMRFAESSHDESELAASVANSCGRQLVISDLTSKQTSIADDFACVVHHVDGQLADSSALAAYRLAAEVRKHVKVALTGDGGDDLFGGYPTYFATNIAARLGAVPKPMLSRAARLVGRSLRVDDRRLPPREKLFRLLAGLSASVPHSAWRQYLPAWERKRVYGSALAHLLEEDPLAPYAAAYSQATGDSIDRGLIADQAFYLPADMLVKMDRVSMAHGLELRLPFLDKRVMGLANTIDHNLLISATGKTKMLLRSAFLSLGGPASVANAQKMGFNVPMNALLRTALRPLAIRLLDVEACSLKPWCSPDGVRAIWREHDSGVRDNKYLLWTLLTLAIWRERTGIV